MLGVLSQNYNLWYTFCNNKKVIREFFFREKIEVFLFLSPSWGIPWSLRNALDNENYVSFYSMNMRILTSSSAGNCTLLWDTNTAMIIDCGCSFSYAMKQLDDIKIPFSALKGACVTHIHSDHINKAFLRKLFKSNVPVYCDHAVIPFIPGVPRGGSGTSLQPFPFETFSLETVSITPFPVHHDSSGGCSGFCIEFIEKQKKRKITIATDIGNTTKETVRYFSNSDLIIIESNHDEAMLFNDSIPYFLKQRIQKAHLSNSECADFLTKVLYASEKVPEAIVLAHISQQRNKGAIARDCIFGSLKEAGHENIPIVLSYKGNPSEIVSL
ncbi:MAG: MBL fold metallo-hydrolase [Chitinivibrionales bacterium]|nr:MBL fold metallo-hydrolase [Chitinivibrionales bacterium]